MVREGYSVELRSIQRMRLNGKPEGSLPGKGSRLCHRAWEALKPKGEQRAGAEAEQDKMGRQVGPGRPWELLSSREPGSDF